MQNRLTAPAQNARSTVGSAAVSLTEATAAMVIGGHFGRVAQTLCVMFKKEREFTMTNIDINIKGLILLCYNKRSYS